jgi:hypothetical protein
MIALSPLLKVSSLTYKRFIFSNLKTTVTILNNRQYSNDLHHEKEANFGVLFDIDGKLKV